MSLSLSLTRRLSLTGAAAFTPAALFAGGGQGIWYDPSDRSTLFQDAAGTIPVTADGQVVDRINDKSGNGNHWTCPIPDTGRPLYRTDGTLHWLQWDGVDDVLKTDAGRVWPASADCYAAVQTTDTSFLGYYDYSSAVEFMFVGQDGSTGAQHLGVGSPTVLVNGASAGATRDTLHDAVTGAAGKVLEANGAVLAFDQLAWGPYPNFEFTGKFFGGIVCPANASARASVRTYLGAKAGIVL